MASAGTPPVEVVHAIPGRIRLRIPELARHRRSDGLLADAIAAAAADHPGVRSVRVNRPSASLVVDYDPAVLNPRPQALVAAWRAARPAPSADRTTGREPPVPATDGSLGSSGEPRRSTPIALAAGGLSLALLGVGPLAPIGGALTLASAVPILGRAASALFQSRRASVDQLDAAAVGVMLALGDVRGAALMSGLVAVGEEIRDRTARRSKRAMLDLQTAIGRHAWVVAGDERVKTPVDRLVPGDLVAIYPGDLIPVDGTVSDGVATVDQKMLTGESRPVTRRRGDEVLAGTTVADGKLYVRAQAVGAATRAGWIIRSLEEAPLQDTRAANHAGRLADRLVVPTFLLAGASLVMTRNPGRAASILIMDFATGIRVSAPTAVMATLSRAAADGVLIKGGRAVEQLAAVDAVVFDKTGTLTMGDPVVTGVEAIDDVPEREVMALAAAAEARLRHPAARAVVRHARTMGIEIRPREDSEYEIGMGVRARVGGRDIRVGSERYLAAAGIEVPRRAGSAQRRAERIARAARFAGRHRRDDAAEPPDSDIWVAEGGRAIGRVAIADPARRESGGVVAWLGRHGIRDVLMVSGDHERTAQAIATRLGIDRVHAGTMPDEKAAIVTRLREEGRVVAVVGDGINDSPALALADVSISLHRAADVARENADVVLMDSNLWKLPHAITLARDCMGLIRQDFAAVAVPNAAGLALGVAGMIGPFGATVLNNGSSVVAAANSLRPLVRVGQAGLAMRSR